MSRGPTRARSEDLSPAAERKRKSRGMREVQVLRGNAETIAIPAVSDDWHPYAAALYRSLLASPMKEFWVHSDYMVAFMASDMYSRVLGQGQRPSADMMRIVTQMLSSIGADERERRAMGIEVTFEREELTPEMAALMSELEAEWAEGDDIEGDEPA